MSLTSESVPSLANPAIRGRNKGTEEIKLITEVIQRYEVHVESRLIAFVPLTADRDALLHRSIPFTSQPARGCISGSVILGET